MALASTCHVTLVEPGGIGKIQLIDRFLAIIRIHWGFQARDWLAKNNGELRHHLALQMRWRNF